MKTIKFIFHVFAVAIVSILATAGLTSAAGFMFEFGREAMFYEYANCCTRGAKALLRVKK